MARRRRSPQQVYWDTVRSLEIQQGLTVNQARAVYRDLRALVGQPLDPAALGELGELTTEAVERRRPRVRRPPVRRPAPAKRPARYDYVLTSEYGKRGHEVTVDIRVRFRGGARREEKQVRRALLYFSRHEEWPEEGWELETIYWQTPRGHEREGSEEDVGAFQGLLQDGPLTDIRVGEEEVS
jgi:hypothetical protein